MSSPDATRAGLNHCPHTCPVVLNSVYPLPFNILFPTPSVFELATLSKAIGRSVEILVLVEWGIRGD